MRPGHAGVLAALLLLAACASPVRTTELAHIDQFSGYRYTTLDKKAPKTIDKAAVILTFSGGGTRAAALADGASARHGRDAGEGRHCHPPLRQPDRSRLLGLGRQRDRGLFRPRRHRWPRLSGERLPRERCDEHPDLEHASGPGPAALSAHRYPGELSRREGLPQEDLCRPHRRGRAGPEPAALCAAERRRYVERQRLLLQPGSVRPDLRRSLPAQDRRCRGRFGGFSRRPQRAHHPQPGTLRGPASGACHARHRLDLEPQRPAAQAPGQ